jgi:hypothetical protein
MTCREVRLYIVDLLRRDCDLGPEPEHLIHCADCARFVEVQRDLGAGLRLTRQSVPPLPASLDDAVLANYRKHIADRPVPGNATLRRRRFAVLCWSAAAAVVLVSGILLFHGWKAVTTIAQPPLPQSATASQPPATVAAATGISKPKSLHAAAHRALHQHPAPSVTMLESPLPTGFRSLMYCDELSCGGAMEVIRVQLPPSVAALAAASNSTDGAVFADVLVGPDGIARGIRIVE